MPIVGDINVKKALNNYAINGNIVNTEDSGLVNTDVTPFLEPSAKLVLMILAQLCRLYLMSRLNFTNSKAQAGGKRLTWL